MKKKFLRGIAAFLAVIMMMPTAAFAEDGSNAENEISTVNTSDNTVLTSNTETSPTELIILNGEDNVTNSTIHISDSGAKNTVSLSIKDGYSVSWESSNADVATVSNGKVTGHKAGNATIYVYYNKNGVQLKASCTIAVDDRTVNSISVTENNVKKTYNEGETFNTSGLTVTAAYSDGTTETITNYSISPNGMLRESDKEITISYKYKEDTVYGTVSGIEVKKVTSDFTIESPSKNTSYNIGDKISASDIEIKVTESNGNVFYLKGDSADVSYSPTGALTASNTALEVTYGGVTKSVAIKVKSSTTLSGLTVTASSSAKTEYYVGESFKSTGYTFTANYSDGTTKNVTTNLKYSPSSFTTTGNSIPVTITYTENSVSKTATVYVKVSDKINVTGISTTTGYKTVVADDAKVKLGDELDWEDLFDSVYIKYKNSSGTTKYKEISDEDDLEDWLGSSAELYVIVDDKEGSKADIVEEDDIDDGKVDLKLYLDYAGTKYSYSFDMEVSDVACTVTVYRSNGTTKIGDSKVFDDLEEALEYLEDKDDIVKDFGVSSTYKNNFVVKIKLGEDQDLDDFEFSPDHDHSITIDLNGYELELESEWIDYNNDSEDIKITVTNTNDDEYGTLIYSDLSTSLIVADGSELEFSEGNIPMDSDAVCTVTIYKNSNSTASSNVIKTKVYDSLSEALEFFEDSEEFEEEFDDELSEKNVITLKLGKDQTLTNFKFAPVFDNTITIDLNGYTLKLKSTWIDYEDCEELVLYVTNTNKDKKATLTYTDLSNSLTVANGDSLKFKDGEIPGIYDVAISSTTNGKVTMSKDTVAHGGTVTFTITPNAGYAISTVKVNNKSITTSTDGYTVNSSTGVGKYEMKNITEDVTIAVTFKASSSSSTGSSSAADWKNTFTDISVKDQYYDAVAFVCSEGLMNGVADNSYTAATKFKPLENMTRAQFVTVLGRLAGIDATKYSGSSFTDVSTTDDAKAAWAAPYIEWAVQNGITNGMGNGKFAPSDPVTHQQMYLMMYRYALYVENVNVSLANVSLTSIKDYTEIADWAEEGVKFASRYGILITSGSKLTPADNALRCELAMLLHGFCKNVLNYNG